MDLSDTVILRNELAYVDVLPVAFVLLDVAADASQRASMAEKNLRVLLASAALEEHGQIDKADDGSPHAADLLRMEQKLNLMLDVVGYLLAQSQSRPLPTSIRLNALGAIWQATDTNFTVDSRGVLQVYLRECLVQPLNLPARVVAIQDHETHLEFDSMPDAVSDQLEKLVFRRHRRQVAGARHGRRS
jgi:hypothetical protein